VAPQRDEIFKQIVNDCVQHIILQRFTNFHGIWSWSFQDICNEIRWPIAIGPVFCATLYYDTTDVTDVTSFDVNSDVSIRGLQYRQYGGN